MPTSPELELVWDGGSLDLMGVNDTPFGPVEFAALGEGTEWGNPKSIRRELFSALADGSASVKDRDDNRTVVVKLQLTAADGAALAGGEAPLHLLSTKRRAELRWTPPNDFAATSAFVVVASDLTHDMNDFDENDICRTYTLTLTCLPFALSVDPVVIEAVPEFVATPAVLDDCSSTTGWSTTDVSMTLAVVSGAIEVSATPGQSGYIFRAGTLARTKRYLAIEFDNVGGRIDWNPPPTYQRLSVRTTGGAGIPPMVASEGRWRFFDMEDLPAGDITQINFPRLESSPDGGVLAKIFTIAESDAPATATGRQSVRTLETPGSARTAGSITVQARDGESALEEVIVFTGPQYDPRLSLGHASDGPNEFALSGALTISETVFTFYRKVSELPKGTFSLWGNPVRASGSGAVDWTIQTSVVDEAGTVVAGPRTQTTTLMHNSSDFLMQPFGLLDLPGAELPPFSTHRVKIVLTASVLMTWDEGLIFHVDGDLTILQCNYANAWLESADLEHFPRVLRGDGTYSEAVGTSAMQAWSGVHRFTPPVTHLYVGTIGVLNPLVTGTFRPAHFTHAAL